jgi:hypothetical protein
VLEKVQKINDFLKLDDPRKEFRHVKKAYDEVKQALNDHLVALKKEVKALYEAAFKELEQEADKRKVSKDKYADKEYTIRGIDNISSLASLQNKQLRVDEFKGGELKKIIAATTSGTGGASEPETYYVTKGATTISNIEELEAYLEKVRKEMTQLIIDKKTIILK